MTEGGARGERAEAPSMLRVVAAWLVVGAPLAWGIYDTFKKALQLFT
jgi:hypothetical protein